MERAAPIEQQRSRPQMAWIAVTLTLLFIVLLIVRNQALLGWVFTDLLGQPLVLIGAAAMFLLPGLAVLRLLWPDPLEPIERWPLAIGISCALPPLMLLASMPLGLRWNSGLCWGYLLVSGLIAFWPQSRPDITRWRRLPPRPDNAHLMLIGITLAVIVVRLYVVRDLPVGMWGDSYHHTIIAQLLLDHGRLFSSWQPYAPLLTFTYHFGLHSNIAWLSWLTGEPPARSLLLVGQLQNALAVPLLFVFTRRLGGSTSAALWAALLVGFVATMPSFYVNWGRYTQLAGQTILPVVCIIWMALLDATTQAKPNSRQQLRFLALAVLTTAGLALTHYRVGVFAACFVLAYALYLLFARIRSLRSFARLSGVGIMAGVLVVLIVSPWLLRLRESKLLMLGQYFASNDIGTSTVNTLPPLQEIIWLYLYPPLLGLALVGSMWLFWQRQWRSLVLVLWAGLVWLAANPYLIALPGAGILTSYAVVIANYLVLVPLAGMALSGLCTYLGQISFSPALLQVSQAGIAAGLLLWGLGQQQQIIAHDYELFTPADAAAMAWIERNTPQDATFFVNSFPAYSNTIYAGSDGGWWIPFMTGRQTNLPPLIHGTEAGEQPNYQLRMQEHNDALQRAPLADPATVATLRASGYDYLYDGPAANPGGEYIDPTVLTQSSLYDLVYDQDGVTIWRMR